MTLIEFFDESALENFAACLLLPVDKMILLGDSPSMEAAAERYRALLKNRNRQVCIEIRKTGGKSLGKLTAQLRGIVLSEPKCVIDLNGGDEMVIMAAGAMLAGLDERQRKKVSVQSIDPKTGTIRDCDGDGMIVKGQPASLTVSELISLYGGIVYPKSYQPPRSYTVEDLEPIWTLVTEDPGKWNRTLSALSKFEKHSSCVTEDRMEIFVLLDYVRNEVAGFEEKEDLVRQLLNNLAEKGLIKNRSTPYYLSYTYKSPLIRYCTDKAGNALEIKTLLEARALTEGGIPCFQDCQVGVSIDWDGKTPEEKDLQNPVQQSPETRNEIDLILIQGLRTLFISCKNGQIPDEEVYKLNTVATRFGGPNVRKMLIVSEKANISPALAQRTKDMGIYLVKDAAKLTPYRWKQIFREAMQ